MNALNRIIRRNRIIPRLTLILAQTCPRTRGYFQRHTWRVVIRENLLQNNPIPDDFAELIATFYHKCRPGEQWFLITQAVAAGYLSLPDGGFNFPYSGYPAQTISRFLGIPLSVAKSAIRRKKCFPTAMFAQVKGWYSVKFTEDGRALEKRVRKEFDERPHDKTTFRRLHDLALEKDAYDLDSRVRDRFQAKFQEQQHSSPTTTGNSSPKVRHLKFLWLFFVGETKNAVKILKSKTLQTAEKR